MPPPTFPSPSPPPQATALIHEWLTTFAGSERAFEAIAELYPDAPLHVLIKDDNAIAGSTLRDHPIHESLISKLPFARKHFRLYLNYFAYAYEQFDLTQHDLIITSSHTAAKSVLTRADQLHLCYCYTPMRYAWDLYHPTIAHTAQTAGRLKARLTRRALHRFRIQDALSAQRVDRFAAISPYVADRIWKTYRRPAHVIYPPVDTDRFDPSHARDDFYLVVSRLVPQKRIPLIAEAFVKLDRPLVIIGDGPERQSVQRIAEQNSNIQYLGYQDDNSTRDHFQRCRAFIFAADDDFGIAPVEAMAAGAPVIAHRKGGVTATVIHNETGFFFDHLTPQSLADAVRHFEDRSPTTPFDPHTLNAHAESYSRDRFKRRFRAFVAESQDRFRRGHRLT